MTDIEICECILLLQHFLRKQLMSLCLASFLLKSANVLGFGTVFSLYMSVLFVIYTSHFKMTDIYDRYKGNTKPNALHFVLSYARGTPPAWCVARLAGQWWVRFHKVADTRIGGASQRPFGLPPNSSFMRKTQMSPLGSRYTVK